MCSGTLSRFNDRNNVGSSEIQTMVENHKSSMSNYRLIDIDLEWEGVKYSLEGKALVGYLEAMLSYKTESGDIMNMHIGMTVKLTNDCQLSQAYFRTINTF